MRAVDIIRRKREGAALTAEEIQFFIRGCANGDIPDYQTSALLMAVFWRGMNAAELAALTDAMIHSGEVIDLSSVPGVKVDKHSTGGVGDKVSLTLAPMVAAAGVPVPMVSGRALGHTGGTLDKLESIPGFQVHLTVKQFVEQVGRIGVAMMGQTDHFVPADRKLYALRDVTATVESIPLIAASIMSKKIAEGADALVMDVKTGNGAFMAEREQARTLAATMCAIGREMGRRVVCFITDMNQPLGRAVGNSLELIEAINSLKGAGPRDFMEVCLTLGEQMLILGGVADSQAAARDRLRSAIKSGAALEKMRQLIEAQGGDPRVVDDYSLLPAARSQTTLEAPRGGYIAGFDTRLLGVAGMILGAGRERAEDPVDHGVGFIVHKKIGDPVAQGEPILTLHFNDPERLRRALDVLRDAVMVTDDEPSPPRLIKEKIALE
ncbi:MAG: pyrimidine-nucleoside phosphorylase [Candidatus Sumerlaeia bacterium]